MAKKIEVEIEGRKFRIMEHMLEDASRYGASVVKRQVKEAPKELLKIPEEPKKVVLPPIEVVNEVKIVDEPDLKKVTRKPRKNEGVKK